MEFLRLRDPECKAQQTLKSSMAAVRHASSPEPAARLSQCCFRSAAPTLTPGPRAGFSSIAASGLPLPPMSSVAAKSLEMWPQVMAQEMSGLKTAAIEP